MSKLKDGISFVFINSLWFLSSSSNHLENRDLMEGFEVCNNSSDYAM